MIEDCMIITLQMDQKMCLVLLFYYRKNHQDVFYAICQNFSFYLLVPEYDLRRAVCQFLLI